MKHNLTTLLFVLLIGSTFSSVLAATTTLTADPCEDYQNGVTLQVEVYKYVMYYYVSYNGIRPQVDSVWIEDENSSIVLTSYAQSAESIDISSLGDGEYSFHCQIGNCVVTKDMLITCAKYRHINLSVSVRTSDSTVHYDVSNNGTITPPYVDSVWITLGDSVELTCHAQSKEPIDISFLTRGYHILHIQMGECVTGRMFMVRWKATTDTTDTPVTPDPCEDYQNLTITVAVDKDNAAISYTLSENGTTTPLHVDSIWLTNNAVHPVVLTGNAQPGESIDVSFLRKDMYVLWVKIGDCIIDSNTFRLGDTAMDIATPTDSEAAVKIFRNGQLLIRRNSKTYTLQGVEITQ
ncbi:MAG: hypothetical protein ACI30A_04465 [Paludibacteraceae bacterium]